MRRAALPLLAVASTAWALPPGRYLEPEWAYSSTARLEWVAVANGSAVLATAVGHVHVFDFTTGPDPGMPALSATPGVRFGGTADGHAFLFDHLSVYACARHSPGAWAWQFAAHAVPVARPDDPEQLPGWNEVAVVPGGPLVATGAGRLLWLATHDGGPRWELKLGRWSTVRLFARPEHAAVVWSESGRTFAALVPLNVPAPVPTRITLDDEAPLWLGLTADGLLAVTPQRLTTWSWNGARHDVAPHVPPQRAATVVALELPDEAANRAQDTWLAVGAGTRPHLLSARTGQPAWGVPGAGSAALRIESLDHMGNNLVAVNGLGAVVYDVRTGHVRAASRRAAGQLAGAHVTDTQLYALYLSAGFTDPVGELVRTPLGGGRTIAWTLVPTGHVRQVVWTSNLMLVLENHALRAYRLP